MISIIVAVARNGVIGDKNALLWHISEDLRNFKRVTTGHPVVMGRNTFLSLGRPLPGRTNVVVSRTVDQIEGCRVVLRRSENAETVTVTTVVRYESRYGFSLGEDGVLTVRTEPFPELTRPRDKMLAFLFSPTAAEMQIVIDLPEDTPVTAIAGETVIAAE